MSSVQHPDEWPLAFAQLPLCTHLQLIVLTVPVQSGYLSPDLMLPCADEEHLNVLSMLLHALPDNVLCVRFELALQDPLPDISPVALIRLALPWTQFAPKVTSRAHLLAVAFSLRPMPGSSSVITWSDFQTAFITQPFDQFSVSKGVFRLQATFVRF